MQSSTAEPHGNIIKVMLQVFGQKEASGKSKKDHRREGKVNIFQNFSSQPHKDTWT